MQLNTWARKWGIPKEAITQLRHSLGAGDFAPSPQEGESEAAIQTRIRLEASQKGMRLWRNNVGATYTAEGTFIRYGLANDSKQMNAHVKSHDLIGIRPVVITQDHVGCTIGQFVSREVKRGDWTYLGNESERAQLRFAEIVVSLGGDAAFVNREGSL